MKGLDAFDSVQNLRWVYAVETLLFVLVQFALTLAISKTMNSCVPNRVLARTPVFRKMCDSPQLQPFCVKTVPYAAATNVLLMVISVLVFFVPPTSAALGAITICSIPVVVLVEFLAFRLIRKRRFYL